MMTIATSQYRHVRQSCRSPNGHDAACFDRQLGPPSKTRLPIGTFPFGHDDPLSHRLGADQCTRSTGRNSYTATAAAKSP
jgi:hypothetical protein